MDACVFDYPKLAKALLKDCHFEVVCFVDQQHKTQQRKERIDILMNSLKEVADDSCN